MYSVAPGGGITITGFGETGGADTLGLTGGEAVGETLVFVGVVWAGDGLGGIGRTVGAVAEATTIGTGLSDAEFADAADADCAATLCLMTP